jgi:hypothetical protein
MYANASDVDTVMVDGKILKRGGKLVGIDWIQTRKELLASTKAIRERAKDAPFDAIMEHVYGLIEQMMAKANAKQNGEAKI